MKEVFLVSACRTPVGRFQGALAGFTAPELGALAISNVLDRAGVNADRVDEVVMGNVLQAGVGQNPARQAALGAGIPDSVPPFTVNKVCGSGLKAINLAAQAIRAGDASLVVAGGMESMSKAPYLVPAARTGARLGDSNLVDAMIHDGLWDAYSNQHMGMTGELVADKFDVARDSQDGWALLSHKRASTAWSEGQFEAETFSVEVPQKSGDGVDFSQDEGVRGDLDLETLANLRPAFKKNGSVTPGNASQISDGAAAAVVASSDAVDSMGLEPLARITGYASGGTAPEMVMMAPQYAIENLEARTGFSRHDFDLIEINEAFASGSCALMSSMGLDTERVNVNGGAIAIGHPIGASGARLLATLVYALKARSLRTGLATLCLGGGNAVATSIELV